MTLLAAAVALTAGCNAVSAFTHNNDVSNPLTPDQAKSQVVEAARNVVATLGIEPIEPGVWLASCNDQGDPPFRGRMRIGYPLAADPDASKSQIADMVRRLESTGWSSDTQFSTHGSAVKRDGVVVVFDPQSVADTTRGIHVFGECRDVTTTKDTKGSVEDVELTPQ